MIFCFPNPDTSRVILRRRSPTLSAICTVSNHPFFVKGSVDIFDGEGFGKGGASSEVKAASSELVEIW